MKRWFRRRERAPLPSPPKEEHRPQEAWEARLRQMERTVADLANRQPQIVIEHLVIQQPVLEKLEFRLDGLDIEHLSGSLNLGNNFGTNVAANADVRKSPAASQERKAPAADPADPPSPGQSGLRRTPTGFRFDNRR
ncbi:hypothetical protein [Cohnella sp. REN36]|uniref:hypothetical protein n=1 Tax=Cohnella sp. REN36 TaxID=2887347 RepID=UPI001D13FCA1|nr:hypothetical protein [Cohnella sp. REN36]MCC3373112.1 hypothetical protein [Cohnella sp. REN36]